MAEPSTVECPGCFQQKGSESATCPRCGYNSNAPRSLSLLPVQTQLKRYLIGEKLGQGGFGITYRGFDLKLKMRVAIKEYYPSDFVSRSNDRKTVMLISSENGSLFQYGLQAFVNEAHTLAQLQHPNLVRVLNLFEMNGTAYLVMDYYEGETLHDYLARQPDKKLPWRRAVNLLVPVLDGLREVHRNGFMHRDVKPRNLYLTQRGQLVLLDFGAARQVVSDRTRSLAIYTSGYAAYEQHVQGEQGPWTDVYGVAATLYFALTAHVPPPASERKQKDSRKPARHFSPDLPPALDNVLNRALVVEPKKRLQTIEEFEQQLRAILKQEEDKPRAEQSREVKPRSPRLWAMAGALLLAVVAASVIGIVIPSPKPPEQRPTPVAGPPLKSVEPPSVATTPPPPPKQEEPALPPVVAPVSQTPPVEPVIPPPVAVVPPPPPPVPLPEMVQIAGGRFPMGSPETETGRDPNEKRHEVTVKEFEMGRHEVTVGEFQRFVDASGYWTDAERNAGGEEGCHIAYREGSGWTVGYRAEYSWRNPGFKQGDDHPVACVSWNDAMAYVEWLSKETGRDYRLPTEAEWEYAARAGTATARYWGDDPNRACRYGNVGDRTAKKTFADSVVHECTDSYTYTAPVGTFEANGWGLKDMLGNVWEWTCSLYDEDYGGAKAECTDKDTAAALAVRGGGWDNEPAWVRSAFRYGDEPALRNAGLGFRLARSL